MTIVKRLMDMRDDTIAPRDALGALAFAIDSGCIDATTLLDFGLAAMATYDPSVHGDDIPAVAGDPIAVFTDTFKFALSVGRERYRQRYAVKKH